MSLSGLLRAAWVAVPAALVCGGAAAQQIITVPPGMVVILTPGGMPGTANAPVLVETRPAMPATTFPSAIERVFAEQRAMMDRMMAGMNALFSPAANPDGLIRAMLGQMGVPAPGTMPATAGTFCAESVSISYNGHDNAPIVKVSRAGGGCGRGTGVAPIPAETAAPAVHRPDVIQVNDPVPLAEPRVRHRT